MQTGIELIAKERQEQIEKHGRTIELDVKYNEGEQLREFSALLLTEGLTGQFHEADMEYLPEGWNKDLCRKMMLKDYHHRLIIVGAMIAAEIDRINHPNLQHHER